MQSIRALVAERGPALSALFVLHRVLQTLSGGHVRLVPYALVAQPLGAELNPVRADPSTVIRRVAAEDPVVSEFPRPVAINQRRWQSGAQCHVVTVKGQFAGTLWIQSYAYEEDEVRALFVLDEPAQSVWDFDVFVVPRYRLGRTMARLWKSVDAELCSQGKRWSFSRISLLNPESMKSHARLGAVIVQRAWFLVVGPLQISVWSEFPYVHFGWKTPQRPVIHLRPPRPKFDPGIRP